MRLPSQRSAVGEPIVCKVRRGCAGVATSSARSGLEGMRSSVQAGPRATEIRFGDLVQVVGGLGEHGVFRHSPTHRGTRGAVEGLQAGRRKRRHMETWSRGSVGSVGEESCVVQAPCRRRCCGQIDPRPIDARQKVDAAVPVLPTGVPIRAFLGKVAKELAEYLKGARVVGLACARSQVEAAIGRRHEIEVADENPHGGAEPRQSRVDALKLLANPVATSLNGVIVDDEEVELASAHRQCGNPPRNYGHHVDGLERRDKRPLHKGKPVPP